jgi:hypothetical protein
MPFCRSTTFATLEPSLAPFGDRVVFGMLGRRFRPIIGKSGVETGAQQYIAKEKMQLSSAGCSAAVCCDRSSRA